MEEQEGLFLYEEPEEMSEEQRRPKPKVRLIPFSLGNEWYALDLEDVREVLKVPLITPVPSVPEFILGVINVRGNIISITDLKRWFNLSETAAEERRILVVQQAKKTTGLLVDSVDKALTVLLENLQPALSTIPKISAEYIKGELKLEDGRLLTVLDLEKLMSSEQMVFE